MRHTGSAHTSLPARRRQHCYAAMLAQLASQPQTACCTDFLLQLVHRACCTLTLSTLAVQLLRTCAAGRQAVDETEHVARAVAAILAQPHPGHAYPERIDHPNTHNPTPTLTTACDSNRHKKPRTHCRSQHPQVSEDGHHGCTSLNAEHTHHVTLQCTSFTGHLGQKGWGQHANTCAPCMMYFLLLFNGNAVRTAVIGDASVAYKASSKRHAGTYTARWCTCDKGDTSHTRATYSTQTSLCCVSDSPQPHLS